MTERAGASSLNELRLRAGGRYLPLRAGLTHIVDEGGEDQPTVLLLHGATVPNWEFDRLVPHLRAAGLRIVRFDFLGHGLSDRPAVAYDFGLFLDQALEVLDGLRVSRPLTLLGHSFGAAIAAALAHQRPASVGRLVLVAPLLDFMASSLWPRAFGLLGLGRPLMRWIGLPTLERRRERRYAAIGAHDLTPRFIAEARAPGYAEALASMFARRTLGNQGAHYRRLQPLGLETLVIAGAADRVVPLHDVTRVRALLPRHRYLEIAGAEHNLLLTHPEPVARALTTGV
ncbi:MAG: alpha/beta fold hydrolase [Roseateles asaccharophilus]|uniref:Alpha-beta hydrolase superfamily lysophospholipase n=1 Tax=Roseateles asaccharophilus TaxID=582607 RepID=A0A4R6NCZ0_9BURK|nr:alpha/beta fold hydrolase [Roseateles asaccharophilus]MDN3546651.1 alpha/beta fold hydrolase [Roseateles asaccharophilus]TDP12875.1 alpha-beta hydrolase superfamily lysophospholipase [Roseateles asaccharophilus]